MSQTGLNRLKHFFRAIQSNGHMLVVVLIVSISLLLMNYFTIKILSGVRAYISGESQYAKGQKDASQNLLMYIDTEDEFYWQRYKDAIKVNEGDRLARESLTKDSRQEAREGLLLGKNHPQDLDVLVWLFVTFKDYSFMREPIEYWVAADALIEELNTMAEETRSNIETHQFDKASRLATKKKIYNLSVQLTDYGRLFAGSLGSTARQVKKLLLVANTFFILIIVGGSSTFFMRLINKLTKSEHILLQKNMDLRNTNNELDRFVYSASHDLRAPITSLKGLIKITSMEKDEAKRQEYFSLMNLSLTKQDSFIRKIISFSKNKRSGESLENVDLKALVKEILGHLEFMTDYPTLEIKTDILEGMVKIDVMRMEIVLSNIISNAIKYSDKNKANPMISIKACQREGQLWVTVEDNGIGISEDDKEHIFDMFYMTKNNEDGTGIGLYIVKESIEKMSGKIRVESTLGEGSTFIIIIPMA